jgi:vacuolar-type H+-ATPase subunit C/Vma6
MIATLDLPTLDARACGLRAKLFGRAELEAMAGAPSAAALARELEQAGRLLEPIERPATVASIESAVRHTAARHLGVLSRWAGPGSALDLFYADQDRRSLRALLRGALQGAPSDDRLAGLLPTPRLPERALTLLARQPTPSRVAAQLVLLHHPDAPRLSALTARAQPVLLDLERALVRGFAERSLAAARAADRNLREVVRTRIDVCNIQMALAFVGGPRDVEAGTLFTDGGLALARTGFVEASLAPSVAEATLRLERALAAGKALQRVVRAAGGDPSRLELLALRQALVEQRRVARLDPLGSAPLVLFLLRLQAQTADLRRLAWGAALGAPAELLRSELVTPWS